MEPLDPPYQGYMRKLSPHQFKGFQRRYFVLQNDRLEYYKTLEEFRQGRPPRGSIVFDDISYVQHSVNSPTCGVDIVTKHSRTFSLRGADTAERDWWMGGFHQAGVACRDGGARDAFTRTASSPVNEPSLCAPGRSSLDARLPDEPDEIPEMRIRPPRELGASAPLPHVAEWDDWDHTPPCMGILSTETLKADIQEATRTRGISLEFTRLGGSTEMPTQTIPFHATKEQKQGVDVRLRADTVVITTVSDEETPTAAADAQEPTVTFYVPPLDLEQGEEPITTEWVEETNEESRRSLWEILSFEVGKGRLKELGLTKDSHMSKRLVENGLYLRLQQETTP